MAVLLDGKAQSMKMKTEARAEIESYENAKRRRPCLSLILVGENPASQIYVRNKVRDCEEVGILPKQFLLSNDTEETALLRLIEEQNADETVDGILVQLPLPFHIDEKKIVETISPEKDVDAFHPENVGRIVTGQERFAPGTPGGVLRLLDAYGIPVSGKHCVIVGRSNIVGKPMALLMLRRNATVTVCHSKTEHLEKFIKDADILIVAIGKAGFVTGEMIKPGAVVVDVGINRVAGVLKGDCDFATCEPRAAYMTPVPGGVGPMTRASLLINTLQAYRRREQIE